MVVGQVIDPVGQHGGLQVSVGQDYQVVERSWNKYYKTDNYKDYIRIIRILRITITRVNDGPTKEEPRSIEADCEDDDAIAPGGIQQGCVQVREVP